MCGLAGIYSEAWRDRSLLQRTIAVMTGTLAHRGPDAGDHWFDAEAGIALGHRRLAILELSEAGAQPMFSVCERYVLVFNGEIFNHLELRREIEELGNAPEWRGQSDTETLLAAVTLWGLADTLRRSAGMFALALWDRQERCLSLARDRFGEKPLYYGWVGGRLLFGSELKALRATPNFDAPVCRAALTQYLRFMYVPAPRTIYRGIFKLEPGCILTIDGPAPSAAPEHPIRPGQTSGSASVSRYWSLAAVVEGAADEPIDDEAKGLKLLEETLERAVARQMISDVPLGAFLSGGVDSSLIAALMQRQSNVPVRTFTVGFDEAGFDESPHALAVAQHLGTDHTELRVSEADARAVIPLLPTLYDEPFADSSQIPTYLVCKAARSRVTVALSGDAGDEIFGGYNRYVWGPRLWNRFNSLPFAVRRMLGGGLNAVPVSTWNALGGMRNQLRSGAAGVVDIGNKAHRIGASLSESRDLDSFYRGLVSQWSAPLKLLQAAGRPKAEPTSLLDDPAPTRGAENDQAQMMYRDSMTYMTDDILCKVDRAAMGVGLETRVPFLDPDVAALAWRLPLSMKIRGDVGKWALRQILYKDVPRALIERPKTGFAIPMSLWLRGPLRDWAEALLDPTRMRREGYIDPIPVQHIWHEHLSGRRDHMSKLWTILMFQAWLDTWAL